MKTLDWDSEEAKAITEPDWGTFDAATIKEAKERDLPVLTMALLQTYWRYRDTNQTKKAKELRRELRLLLRDLIPLHDWI